MQEETVRSPNKRGQSLAGLLTMPEVEQPPVVIVSPVLKGDKQYQPVLDPCARALAEEGFAVLRYDATGFGDSEGKPEDMTITTQVQDLEAAIDYVRTLQVDDQRIGLVGFSIGSTCAVLNAHQAGVKALVLWSPPFTHRPLRYRYRDKREEVREKGYFDSTARLTGRPYRIGKGFLEECCRVDLRERLRRLLLPTLAVYGEKDELIKRRTVEYYMNLLPTLEKSVVTIPIADDDFLSEEAQAHVIQVTKDWLSAHV